MGYSYILKVSNFIGSKENFFTGLDLFLAFKPILYVDTAVLLLKDRIGFFETKELILK